VVTGRVAVRGGQLVIQADLIRVADGSQIWGNQYSRPMNDLLAVQDALTRLEQVNAGAARIVECRIFAGMTIEETAAALDRSPATVKRHWTVASAWLARELEGNSHA